MWCMQRTLILWTLKSHLWSILTTLTNKSQSTVGYLYVCTLTMESRLFNQLRKSRLDWIIRRVKNQGYNNLLQYLTNEGKKSLVRIIWNFKMDKAESLRNQDTTVQQCASELYHLETVCCKVILLQCKNELWSYMYLQVSRLDEQFIQASSVYHNIFVKHVEVKCSKITL